MHLSRKYLVYIECSTLIDFLIVGRNMKSLININILSIE